MITRANIRRQLRASGGITNAVPRQQYGLGSFVKKALGKVTNVAKQVVKSPLGKAAILGLGASYLGPKIMGGGFGGGFGGGLKSKLFGSILPGVRAAGMPSFLGETGFTKTAGILGKLGLTKGGGSMGITGLGKMLGAGGLLGYFTSKGASEEEAKSLAADVERGAGIGFDQIQKDIAAYRGGGQDESQMAAKGYRFLTPKRFTQPLAKGGRVGLQAGTPEEGIKSLEAGASSIKVEGDVRPPEIKMQEEMKMAGIPKDLTAADAVKTFELSNGRPPKNMQEVIDFFKNRKLSAMGGIMDMPTGNMRQNKAGIKEIDYRATGGFVPVGIKEKADDVPAMLSKNEFVMTADAVRGAGNGSIKKGAQRMYDLMKQNESKVV
jgi:hypothetical protein